MLDFALEKRHVEEYKSAVSSSSIPGVPFDYVASCYLNALPLNMLTSSGFPLNVVGSVHESTKIEAFRSDGFNAEGARYQARSRFKPEILRSDKEDWLFTIITDITSTGSSGASAGDGSHPKIMTLTNQYRVLNPDRGSVNAQKSKVSPPDYSNDPSWSHVASWSFPVSTGRDFASLNGDVNPIHMYPWSARLLGYSSCISHGMYSVVRLLHAPAFAEAVEEAGRCTVEAKFVRPTLLPAQVKAYRRGEDVVVCVETEAGFKESVIGRVSF